MPPKQNPSGPPLSAKIEAKFGTGDTAAITQSCSQGGGAPAVAPRGGTQDAPRDLAAMNKPQGVTVGGASGTPPTGGAAPVAPGTGQPATVVVYRKMCNAEAVATLRTKRLQPSIGGSNGKKYLSESRAKVMKFENQAVAKGTDEKVVEFTLDKDKYDALLADKVRQDRIRKTPDSKVLVEYHYEGLKPDGPHINIGVPSKQLPGFNEAIIDVRVVPPDEKPK